MSECLAINLQLSHAPISYKMHFANVVVFPKEMKIANSVNCRVSVFETCQGKSKCNRP